MRGWFSFADKIEAGVDIWEIIANFVAGAGRKAVRLSRVVSDILLIRDVMLVL